MIGLVLFLSFLIYCYFKRLNSYSFLCFLSPFLKTKRLASCSCYYYLTIFCWYDLEPCLSCYIVWIYYTQQLLTLSFTASFLILSSAGLVACFKLPRDHKMPLIFEFWCCLNTPIGDSVPSVRHCLSTTSCKSIYPLYALTQPTHLYYIYYKPPSA